MTQVPFMVEMGLVIEAYLRNKAPPNGTMRAEDVRSAYARMVKAAASLGKTSGFESLSKMVKGYHNMKLVPSSELLMLALAVMASHPSPMWGCMAGSYANEVEAAYKKEPAAAVEEEANGVIEL